jgi:hypothetical protein
MRQFRGILFRLILILAAISLVSSTAPIYPVTLRIMPVGGAYHGDEYPEWVRESYVLTTTLSETASFEIEIHNDNNKHGPDDLKLDIWINDPSYTSYISCITVNGNLTSGWYAGTHQGTDGAYRNCTIGSIGVHSARTIGVTVVFSSDPPPDFQMHFDAHAPGGQWQTDQSRDATVAATVPAPYVVQIGVDQPEYVPPQGQVIVNITVDPRSIVISAVQYDLYYNTSVVWAEWANPGPLLKQNGADTDVVVRVIDNRWDIKNKVGKIAYAETTLGSGDGNLPSVNASGTITTICFTALGEVNTSSYLDFGDVGISDPDKLNVPCCILTNCDNEDPVAVAKSMHRVSNVASKFQCFAALCCCNSYGGCDAGAGETITYVRWDFGDGVYETSQGMGDCQKQHEYMTWNWVGGETGHYVNFTAYLNVMDGGCPPESNTTSVEVVVYIAGDTNGDGIVNVFDLASVGKHWGASTTGPSGTCGYYWADPQQDEADLNNDGDVDTLDVMIVGTNWNHLAYPPISRSECI